MPINTIKIHPLLLHATMVVYFTLLSFQASYFMQFKVRSAGSKKCRHGTWTIMHVTASWNCCGLGQTDFHHPGNGCASPVQLLAKLHCLRFIALTIAPLIRLYNAQEIILFHWFGEGISNHNRCVDPSAQCHSAILPCPPTSFDLAELYHVRAIDSYLSFQARCTIFTV